jgi:TRAP-type C4-dicarboxylate transport system substrate-binding protein
MQTRRQLGIQLAALSGIWATGGLPARAAEQTLRFGSISGGGTPTFALLEPYAKGLEQIGGGKLEVALKPAGGYGKPVELLPMVEKGDLEIAATVQGYYPGRFPQTSVIELPLMFDSGIVGSKALSVLFKEGALAKDYAAVKVLSLYVTPPFAVFTTGKKISSLKDMRGMRVRTPGPTVGLALGKLGAIPLGMPADAISAAIANGTVDAIAFSMDSTLGTKGVGDKMLSDQLSVVVDMRFAAPAQLIVMNQAKWDALPADTRAAWDKLSTDFTANVSRIREESEAAARQKFQADARYTFVPYSAQLHDEMKQAMAPVYDDWKADMTKRGLDGDRLLSRTRELVQQFSVAAN